MGRHRLGGGGAPPRNDLHPPEAFGTAPKSFCTPTNYIYFDLIVSYLIILTTKFVKLPILWSQISPCRPKTNFVKLFPWPFRALPPHPGQSKQQHPPPDIYPPPERKYENPSLYMGEIIIHPNYWPTVSPWHADTW